MTKLEIKKTGRLYRKAILDIMAALYEGSYTVIAADFNKVTADDLSRLRLSLASINAKLLVTKLSLFKLFLKEHKKQDLFNLNQGSAGLIFAGQDIVSATKVLSEFIKEHETFKLLGAYFDNDLLTGEKLGDIAKLPSRDELIAKTVMAIKSPLFKLRGVLEQLPRKLMLTIVSAKEKKEKESA